MRFFRTLSKQLGEILSNGDEPGHVRFLADLYWRALLVLGFVVLVAVFSYSTWGVVRILGDLSVTLHTAPPPPPALKRGELDAVIRAFDERKREFEILKTNPSAGIKDPSI